MSKLREKGITLVALVVTIIILLILAGVTISQIGGNNGLFSKVKQAVGQYKNASIDEQLAILEVDKYVSDFTVSEEEGVLIKITKVEVTAGTDTITIKVTVEGNVSKIEYSKDNEKTWQVKEGDEKGTEYIYEEVTPGSYFIKVRATDENGKIATATSDVVIVNPILAEEMATEKEVIEGKKFVTGEGIIKTGSMKKHGKIEETVSPGNPYIIEEGYYEGGTITAEENIDKNRSLAYWGRGFYFASTGSHSWIDYITNSNVNIFGNQGDWYGTLDTEYIEPVYENRLTFKAKKSIKCDVTLTMSGMGTTIVTSRLVLNGAVKATGVYSGNAYMTSLYWSERINEGDIFSIQGCTTENVTGTMSNIMVFVSL